MYQLFWVFLSVLRQVLKASKHQTVQSQYIGLFYSGSIIDIITIRIATNFHINAVVKVNIDYITQEYM